MSDERGLDDGRGLGDRPIAADRERWSALLDLLDVERMTEAFIARVLRIPGYDSSPIPVSQVRRTAAESFLTLIDGLRGGEDGRRIELAGEVGVSRARAGIPLESLMTAIRIDFTALWDELTRVASPADAELVIRHTGLVLTTVDDYVSRTQAAYVAERERMRIEESSVQQGLISALFRETAPTEEQLHFIASELGVDGEADLLVLAAFDEEGAGLRRLISESGAAGARFFTHHLGEALVAFTEQRHIVNTLLGGSARWLHELRIGSVEIVGLGRLRPAALLAAELARAFVGDEHGVMTWADAWARVSLRKLSTAGLDLLGDVERGLAACGDSERARLIEAVRGYLASGSISATATALYCHRNTVANRLRRFHDVTGVDATVPAQAARLVVGWATEVPVQR